MHPFKIFTTLRQDLAIIIHGQVQKPLFVFLVADNNLKHIQLLIQDNSSCAEGTVCV